MPLARFCRMLKYLNPEFALGFLVATIFGAAVLGWQSSYAPTETEKQECREAAKKAGHKTEECKSLWEKTTSDPVAFFTFVLSVSTIGLWAATGIGIFIQTRDTRILQRAYLSVEPGGVAPYASPTATFDPDWRVVAHIRIHNAGHLPARNVSYHFNTQFSSDPHWSQERLDKSIGARISLLRAARRKTPLDR
jgi:hypothetical protein